MNSSIRANLDPFDEFKESKIWRVLQEIHLKPYVEKLDEGLDTELTDQNLFSAGQKQLICLARAILRKNKILVLDEATANVDIETDSFIQNTIRKSFKDCTVLTIAHRIATISDSDTIIVMEDGKIKEAGKPSKILPHLSQKNLSKPKNIDRTPNRRFRSPQRKLTIKPQVPPVTQAISPMPTLETQESTKGLVEKSQRKKLRGKGKKHKVNFTHNSFFK